MINKLLSHSESMMRCSFLSLALFLFVGNIAAQTPDLSGETNLARESGATATASSEENNTRLAANAIDGDATTAWGPTWESGNQEKNSSVWTLQLASESDFNVVRIVFNNQAPQKAVIEYSTDNSTWTEFIKIGSTSEDGYSRAADNQTFVYHASDNGTKRAGYIRVRCIEGGTYGMGFSEFEVYNSTLKLTSISIDQTVVSSAATTSYNFYAYDQFGYDYTNYTLTSNGAAGTESLNVTDIATNPYQFSLTTGALTGTIVFTATDKTATSITRQVSVEVATPVLTSLNFIGAETGKRDLLNHGDYVEFIPEDQFGHLVVGTSVSITTGTGLGSLGTVGDTKTFTAAAAGGGKVTVTVEKDGNSVNHSWYILSNDAIPAPVIPTNVYKPVYVSYDNSADAKLKFLWNTSPADFGDFYTTNGLSFRHIKSARSFVVGRQDASYFPDSDVDGRIKWLPSSDAGKELKAYVFAGSACEARIHLERVPLIDEGWQTLTEGWNELTLDVTSSTQITAIRIETKQKADGTYPDILVSNVYFTKDITDSDKPTWADGYLTVTPGQTSATLTLNATDETSDNVHYFIKDRSTENLLGEVVGAKGVGTVYTLSGLSKSTSYSVDVEVYDEAGNKCDDVKQVDFTTLAVRLTSITVSPTVVSVEKNSTSDALTIVVKDEEDNTVALGTDATITVVWDDDTSDGKSDVVELVTSDGTYKLQPKTGVTKGHGFYNVVATSSDNSSSISTPIEVFVFDPDLHLTFTIDGTEYTANGRIGELEGSLAAKIITEESLTGKTYLDITDLTITGNINDKDIRTLRKMAGATASSAEGAVVSDFQNTGNPDSSTGSLKNLDIKGVKFVATPSYANDVPVGSSEADVTARNTERINEGYVIGKEMYDGALEHPGFITVGGVIENRISPSIGVAGHEILPSYIFDHCIHLESVKLPDGIKQFGEYCFNECRNLTSVTNYGGVIEFGGYTFAKTALASFDFSVASSSLRVVPTGMFRECPELTGVTMPDAIVEIGNAAFRSCPKFNLSSGALPSSLDRIGQYAFWECTSLSSVVVPAGVKRIEQYTFEKSGIASATLQATDFTLIGYRAFTDCKSMTEFSPRTMPATLETIDSWAFAGCDKIAGAMNLSASKLVKISSQSFGWMTNLEQVNLPYTVTEIEAQAFENDVNLATFTFGEQIGGDGKGYENLTAIGSDAFMNCQKISNAFNNDKLVNVATIGERAFKDCKLLQSDDARHLMYGLTKIEDETFAGCTSLEWLALGQNKKLTEIGPIAFSGDVNVNKVSVYTATAPTCYTHYYIEDGATHEVTDNYWNPFRGLVPNRVLLSFEEDAATGDNYLSYRAAMTDGTAGNAGAKEGNGFMYLLTKVMREEGNISVTATEAGDIPETGDPSSVGEYGKYYVVDQPHADVILHRTFAKNWNTFMLPFSMTWDQICATFENTTSGFRPVIAKYGWYTEGSTMYIRPGRNALQFETVGEIAANTPYIFMIVDEKGGSTADCSSATEWTCVNVDIHNEPTTVVGEGYTFTGSYDYQANIVSEDHGILYINKNGGFSYKKAGATTTTKMKGFRSYFTFGKDETSLAKTMDISVELDNVADGVEHVSLEELDGGIVSRGDIYSIGGQLIRRNGTAEGLVPGVYIMRSSDSETNVRKDRKFIVK